MSSGPRSSRCCRRRRGRWGGRRPHRPVVEGVVFRFRVGIPWRDLPGDFPPWQTVWKRHHKWSADGTWDRVLAEVLADADAAGLVDWKVSADSSVVRAHQHGTNTSRP